MNEGHIRLRRGLLEHIDTGKMNGDMLGVYIYLHLGCDYTTGIVWTTSAPYISIKLKKPVKKVQRVLQKLAEMEYIKRFGHRGQVTHYKVLINRYLLHNGVLIDSVNSKDINHIAWTLGVNGKLIGTYLRLKTDLNETYVSSYKELKNIRIKELKIKDPQKN